VLLLPARPHSIDRGRLSSEMASPAYHMIDWHGREFQRNKIPGPPPIRPDDIFSCPDDHPEGKELLAELLESLQFSKRHAHFACGGSVPVSSTDTTEDLGTSQRSTPPVTVRWDDRLQVTSLQSDEQIAAFRATFTQKESDVRMVQKLVSDCQPATFGRGQEDVLDETYRKAGKLDPSEFSTNFCPYETGIVDAVTAMLMTDPVDGEIMLGVRAELYKLNVTQSRVMLSMEFI
jgi:hypothetical protein